MPKSLMFKYDLCLSVIRNVEKYIIIDFSFSFLPVIYPTSDPAVYIAFTLNQINFNKKPSIHCFEYNGQLILVKENYKNFEYICKYTKMFTKQKKSKLFSVMPQRSSN